MSRKTVELEFSPSHRLQNSTLTEMRTILDEWIVKYGPNARWACYEDRDMWIIETITVVREETDEEYQARIESEKVTAERRKVERRNFYEELKAEFE